MPDEKNNLFLYEALELRAEFNSRLETLKELLPEAQNQSASGYLSRSSSENSKLRPIEQLDIESLREEIKKLKNKNRKLNNAIQQSNFETYIQFKGRDINLIEALETRKNINEEIKNLSIQLKKSAYEKIIYKEDRNIVEKPEISYTRIKKELEEKRLEFRKLNRKLRKISFETTIKFKDE